MASEGAPILVVGGRTTGLTMACELARHGVPVRIVDKSPGIDPHCRATVLHSRSLEVFQDLGIVDEVVASGAQLMGMSYYANGRRFMHARYNDLDSPYPCAISVGQNRTEEILEGLLGRLGVRVERETELITLAEEGDGVQATLRLPDGREEIAWTPWLIGCDGAHSRVRHLNHEAFLGEQDPHQYVLADVILDADFARDEVHGFLTDHGVLYLFLLPEPRALVVADVAESHDPETETPTLEDIQALLSERGPAGAQIRDPQWLAYFRISYRLSRHYRNGRTFLAGDAVHVHSPIGGQGMNTGIQDAYNVAWKLALVARGCASEALLDSYEAERRAVAEDVVKTTRMATEKAELFTNLTETERARLYANMVVPEPEQIRMALHREELDLDYRKSPVCAEHRAGGQGFAAGPHAGAQARDAGPLEVDGRTVTLFEVLRGTSHSLLLFAGSAGHSLPEGLADLLAAVLRTHGDLMKVYVVVAGEDSSELTDPPPHTTVVGDPNSALHGRYKAKAGCLYLIRPDGYVAYRSEAATAGDLQRYLDRVF